mmetsp:Transcript_16045/g.55819  ORF Transcript_16045/g.55819 Transcript_16045/m.55819 type:complete len:243 (+) Transcript_16045:662-1390(+)
MAGCPPGEKGAGRGRRNFCRLQGRGLPSRRATGLRADDAPTRSGPENTKSGSACRGSFSRSMRGRVAVRHGGRGAEGAVRARLHVARDDGQVDGTARRPFRETCLPDRVLLRVGDQGEGLELEAPSPRARVDGTAGLAGARPAPAVAGAQEAVHPQGAHHVRGARPSRARGHVRGQDGQRRRRPNMCRIDDVGHQSGQRKLHDSAQHRDRLGSCGPRLPYSRRRRFLLDHLRGRRPQRGDPQ